MGWNFGKDWALSNCLGPFFLFVTCFFFNSGTVISLMRSWNHRNTVYGLHEIEVLGDGNCQFRALSDQLYRSPEHHKRVRKEIVKQLKQHSSLYASFVPMRYEQYRKKMAKCGEWGDHVTLQAAADKFAAKICLVTSFGDTSVIEIMPQCRAPKRELWLSFSSGVHYNPCMKFELHQSSLKQRGSTGCSRRRRKKRTSSSGLDIDDF